MSSVPLALRTGREHCREISLAGQQRAEPFQMYSEALVARAASATKGIQAFFAADTQRAR